MKYKLFSQILSLTLLVGLSGCGGSSDSSPTKTATIIPWNFGEPTTKILWDGSVLVDSLGLLGTSKEYGPFDVGPHTLVGFNVSAGDPPIKTIDTTVNIPTGRHLVAIGEQLRVGVHEYKPIVDPTHARLLFGFSGSFSTTHFSLRLRDSVTGEITQLLTDALYAPEDRSTYIHEAEFTPSPNIVHVERKGDGDTKYVGYSKLTFKAGKSWFANTGKVRPLPD